ncbi:hypothetical protein [Methanobrevibacter sp.]
MLCFSVNLHPTGSICAKNLSCFIETAFGQQNTSVSLAVIRQ